MVEILKDPKVDWIGAKKIFIGIAIFFLLLGAVSVTIRGFKLGVDFSGAPLRVSNASASSNDEAAISIRQHAIRLMAKEPAEKDNVVPATVVRQIELIRRLMGQGYTIQEIQSEFVFLGSEIDGVARQLQRVIEAMERAAATRAAASSPTDVIGLTSGVKQVTAGRNFSCALTTAGGVKCWGSNAYGMLGTGDISMQKGPFDVSGVVAGVKEIATGEMHTCALMAAGGTLLCWGYNQNGQLGNNPTSIGINENSPSPVAVTGLSGVLHVAAGKRGLGRRKIGLRQLALASIGHRELRINLWCVRLTLHGDTQQRDRFV